MHSYWDSTGRWAVKKGADVVQSVLASRYVYSQHERTSNSNIEEDVSADSSKVRRTDIVGIQSDRASQQHSKRCGIKLERHEEE